MKSAGMGYAGARGTGAGGWSGSRGKAMGGVQAGPAICMGWAGDNTWIK